MTSTPQAQQLIRRFEGLRTQAYRCPAGIPTIGYGHTQDVKIGDRITPEQALELLLGDIARTEARIDTLLQAPLNPNQYDALVSFTYNIGARQLAGSTLLRKINQNPDDPDIRRQFQRWIYAGGQPLPGLIRRRQAEADLYFTPPGPTTANT